jgi:putative ABC transport system permease protein
VLSALGITVGSMAIVLLISIAEGVQKDVEGQVNGLGVNLLIVIPFRIPEDDGGLSFNPNVAGLSYLREEFIPEIKQVEGVKQAVPFIFPGGAVRNGQKDSGSSMIIATQPAWFSMRPATLSEGRYFTSSEQTSRVCVLGGIAKATLFGDEHAVGREVIINGEPYKVVGSTVKEEKSDSLMASTGLENVVYVPYEYTKKKLSNPPLSRILIQTESSVEPKNLVAGIEATLAKHLNRDNYSVITQKDLLKLLYALMGILTSLLFGLTSIALFVGGVGIMTVMLMSVGERAREIGIRKTVGARRSDIFMQFLAEAVVLALAGATAGVVLSYGVCLGLLQFTKIKPLMSFETVALSFAVSLLVGAVFGLIPAMKAARQDPVSSLRHD